VEVVIIVPVLGRPHRVSPLIENINHATPEPHRVLFVADVDDQPELDALQAVRAEWIAVDQPRNYAGKINAGYRATTEPLFFMAADDLNFHPDWLSRALKWMGEGIDVVGTNDICNPRVMTGQHSTHTLVRRSYIDTHGTIDEDGKVLHEGYAHEYTDDEFVQTAKKRGVYAHAFDSIVEHLHPNVNKADDDDTYRLGRSRTRESRRLFQYRQRLWA
jgi:glycosyltransferase involved in cell wall biosynthesis